MYLNNGQYIFRCWDYEECGLDQVTYESLNGDLKEKCRKFNNRRFYAGENRKEVDYIWYDLIEEKGIEWYKIARDKAIKKYEAKAKKRNTERKKKHKEMIKRIEAWK